MNREEEKVIECYPFLLDPLFCRPFTGRGAHGHISAPLGAVVPVQCLKTNGSKGGKGSISSSNPRILHGTRSLNRESQADGPHLVARLSVV